MPSFEGRHRIIPAVYVLLYKNEQLLLLRRANTGYQDGNYSLPAGHLEEGETAVQAAAREVEEEVGIRLRTDMLKLVHTMHHQAPDPLPHGRIHLFFETADWSGAPRNMEPDKCDELRWVDPIALPTNMAPEVKLAIAMVRAGKPYSDLNFETR